MRFRLDEIQPGKLVRKELKLDQASITTSNGVAHLENIEAELSFRLDPLGYVIHYKITGRVGIECVRCGNPLELALDLSDWISLRTRQPEHAHIVLDDSEMNIRFSNRPDFDLERFVTEVIELELPPYPKHESRDPACGVDLQDQEAKSEKESSPFEALSRLLESK